MVLRSPGFAYRRSAERREKSAARETALHCERVPLSSLAEEFATPLYVYSAGSIRRRYREFDRAFLYERRTQAFDGGRAEPGALLDVTSRQWSVLAENV